MGPRLRESETFRDAKNGHSILCLKSERAGLVNVSINLGIVAMPKNGSSESTPSNATAVFAASPGTDRRRETTAPTPTRVLSRRLAPRSHRAHAPRIRVVPASRATARPIRSLAARAARFVFAAAGRGAQNVAGRQRRRRTPPHDRSDVARHPIGIRSDVADSIGGLAMHRIGSDAIRRQATSERTPPWSHH